MSDRRVYLDSAASTSVAPPVAERMRRVEAVAGNPSSVHGAGVWLTREVERARGRLADRLGASPEEVVFTSGATESNALALQGTVWADARRDKHVIVSAIEHPSVLETAAWLASSGQARVTHLPVSRAGVVDPDDVAAAITADTVLVSVMAVNNETGAIQPVEAIAGVCRARGVRYHCDAAQGFLKLPLDVGWGIDLLTASGHKVHGPKGVGLLYKRDGLALAPLLHGGSHEGGLRAGTLNATAIAGFGEAAMLWRPDDLARIAALRDRLLAAFPGRVRVHGAPAAPTVLNLAFPGVSGKFLFTELDRRGVLVSASSACHSTRLTPSHVLLAMGYTPDEANEALRVSFGRDTTEADVDALTAALLDLVGASA